MERNNKNILDLFLILAKNKKYVIIPTIIISILSVIYILIVPEYWVSRATFFPGTDQSNNMNLANVSFGLGSSLLGGMFQTQNVELISVLLSKKFSK